jgi:integrase
VAEVERLMKAAQHGRYGHRDATLILVAFRHGLRAACDLEWSQVEFGRSASLHVRRVKNGKPNVHPLRGDWIRALRELPRQFPGPWLRLYDRAGRPVHTRRRQSAYQAYSSVPALPSQFTVTCSGMPAATL